MRLADVRHDTDLRRRDGRHGLDLMEAAHADLHDRRFVLLREPQQRERQADLVVEVRLRFQHRAACRKHRRREVLCRRLAV